MWFYTFNVSTVFLSSKCSSIIPTTVPRRYQWVLELAENILSKCTKHHLVSSVADMTFPLLFLHPKHLFVWKDPTQGRSSCSKHVALLAVQASTRLQSECFGEQKRGLFPTCPLPPLLKKRALTPVT